MAPDISDPAEPQGLRLPNPPPLLHTRDSNDPFDRPATPVANGFTSPASTPQGSPSKNRMPPGALDLPNVFEKAMKLTPSTPARGAHNHYGHPTFSPPKGSGDDFSESVIRQPQGSSTSPTRRPNMENTPPSPTRLPKDLRPTPAPAALSRQEPYQTRDQETAQRRHVHMRGLTPDELEKAQNPRVKRLVNVTQLCRWMPGASNAGIVY